VPQITGRRPRRTSPTTAGRAADRSGRLLRRQRRPHESTRGSLHHRILLPNIPDAFRMRRAARHLSDPRRSLRHPRIPRDLSRSGRCMCLLNDADAFEATHGFVTGGPGEAERAFDDSKGRCRTSEIRSDERTDSSGFRTSCERPPTQEHGPQATKSMPRSTPSMTPLPSKSARQSPHRPHSAKKIPRSPPSVVPSPSRSVGHASGT